MNVEVLVTIALACLAVGAASHNPATDVIVRDSKSLAAALSASEVLRISVKG